MSTRGVNSITVTYKVQGDGVLNLGVNDFEADIAIILSMVFN